MLELGTKVKVKSFADIKKTLSIDGYCGNVRFAPPMKNYCEGEFKIKEYVLENRTYVFEGISWSWLPEWFDVMESSNSDFWNDRSVEERSLCLALCRQALSENPVNLEIFTKSSCLEFPNKINGGFNYCDFSKDDWYNRIAENIPDWPCLRLKPQILEKALQYLLEYHGPSKIQDYISGLVETWFRWDQTSEGADYWGAVCLAIPENTKFKKSELVSVKTTINKINYENQLQRKKSDLVKGTVPEGNIICGRKCKTSVSIGHLSNKVCTGI